MVRKVLSILLQVVIWAAVIAYFVWAAGRGREKREATAVTALNVVVADSARIDILNGPMIRGWILDAGLGPAGKNIDSVDTRALSEFVALNGFVKDVKAYVDLNGHVNMAVTQRKPIMRVISGGGHNFYVTSDDYILPFRPHAVQYVPVVTGDFGLPFDKNYSGTLAGITDGDEKNSGENYLFLYKLINFVKYIGDNEFWNSQIVQINVTESRKTGRGDGAGKAKEPEIELIPRVGDQVILLGHLDGYEEKLGRLLVFYRNALSREGWDKWNHINLKYDGQVVCSNK